MQKKLIVLLLLPLLIFGLCTQVGAVQSADPDKQCSITFLMEFDGTSLDGGKVTLYRVGQISPDGDKFVLVDTLPQGEVSLDNLEDSKLPETLSVLAIEHNLSAHSAPIVSGKAVFSDLQTEAIDLLTDNDAMNHELLRYLREQSGRSRRPVSAEFIKAGM